RAVSPADLAPRETRPIPWQGQAQDPRRRHRPQAWPVGRRPRRSARLGGDPRRVRAGRLAVGGGAMNEAQRKIIEAEARTWTVADERGAAKVLLAFQRFRREVGTDA